MTAGRPAGPDNQRPRPHGRGKEGLAVGTMFLITGTGLFAVSVLARSQWLLAVTCLVIGVQIERAGPPAGVINITLGVLLLLASWNRRQRRRGKPAAVGAKARAARDALVRHMRDRAVPVPA
jgi:hypothetical protein